MTFTKEQLIEEAKQAVEGCRRLLRVSPGVEAHKISLRLAEITLAALTAEPVAFINGAREPVMYGEHIGIAIGTHLYTAPPAPVVPAGYRLQPISEYDAMCAAMLQGAEPVTTAYKLPSREHFILLCNQFWNWQEADEINAGEEEPRLEWNGSEFTNRVTQALWRMYQASPGNSPAIPDGWVACSERMPEDAQWCAFNTEYGYYVQCWSDGQGWLGDEISIPNCDVTHWMPLPAAPQQELK